MPQTYTPLPTNETSTAQADNPMQDHVVNTHPPPATQVIVHTPSPANPSYAGPGAITSETPLPEHRPTKGGVGDISKYYSSPGSRYTGRKSDLHSLSRHKAVYYAQAHLCGLNATLGLNCLINMIDPHTLAGRFYFNDIFHKVPNLETAFEKLFIWDRSTSSTSNMAATLRSPVSNQKWSLGQKLWASYKKEPSYSRISWTLYTNIHPYY